jgi:hypothetical protein
MRRDISDIYNTFNMFLCIERSLTRCWRFITTDGTERRRHTPQVRISLEASTPSRALWAILSNWGSTHSPPRKIDFCQKAAWRSFVLSILLQTRAKPGNAVLDIEKSRAQVRSLFQLHGCMAGDQVTCLPVTLLSFNGSEKSFLLNSKFWKSNESLFRKWGRLWKF